jgi:hypothetical protein
LFKKIFSVKTTFVRFVILANFWINLFFWDSFVG